jgi:serine/threonine protein kinase
VSVSDLSVGSGLLGYRVEAVLGRGGMSVVYLAEDLRLKRKVALKLLALALAEDEAFRERFLVESELAASLDHPNIVPIYAAGEGGERLFRNSFMRRSCWRPRAGGGRDFGRDPR